MGSSYSKKILLVKTSAIGDVIQAFPALEYLRRHYPEARIDWVVEEGIAPLVEAHPQVDGVITIRSRAWRKTPFSSRTRGEFATFAKRLRSTSYDLLFDLQGNAKSSVVTGCALAAVKVGFGWSSVREKLNLLVVNKRYSFPSDLNIRKKYLSLLQSHFEDSAPFEPEGVRLKISKEEELRLQEICHAMGERKKVMVCFGSRWKNKQLETKTLSDLLKKIAADSNPSFLLIYGNEEEKKQAAELSPESLLAGGLSLPLWQALMWEMDGVIAVDSAALHLCGTTATPSWSVFGPSLATIYKPFGSRHEAIQGKCPYGRVFPARCPVLRTCPTGACMREHSTEALFASWKKWAERFTETAAAGRN